MLYFSSDYMEGCHPNILRRLSEINMDKNPGYGTDAICESAKNKIRAACGKPDAEVYFLVGGTQTNAVVIKSMLRSYEGVVAAATGHVAVHEAGAIEAGGHKVLTLPEHNGKLDAAEVEEYIATFYKDANHEHMVKPGMTGLAQVSGYRGDTSIRGRIDCDIAYIENWTIWLDIRIILRTFTSLVNDETLPPLHREK